VVVSLAEFAPALTTLWADAFSTERSERVLAADGTTQQAWSLLIEGEPCTFQPNRAVATYTAEGAPVTAEVPLLICAPDVDIQQGDRLTVVQGTGSTWRGTVGVVVRYQTHIEADVDTEVRP